MVAAVAVDLVMLVNTSNSALAAILDILGQKFLKDKFLNKFSIPTNTVLRVKLSASQPANH